MVRRIRIIGSAFGNPRSETVFSGVSKYLLGALEKKGVFVHDVSTKQIRPWDLFNGAVDWSKTFQYGKPGISVSWLWRKATVNKLSARFNKKMIALDSFDAVFQIGTHVRFKSNCVKHYCFTDMTVAQAIRSPNAKNFSVGKLLQRQHSEAIEAQKNIFKSCDAIFVNSNWAKKSVVCDYQINDSKVHVVGAGVSLPLNTFKKKKTDSHNILFIGRNWIHKGGPILLEAFSLIREEIDDATLTIIGCRPPVHDRNIRVLGLLNKTIDSEKVMMEEAIANAGVLCVPSKFEAYGIVFLEAQLYGVPPVTFAGEGRGDAIKDGVTGILVQERTAKALSKAIVGLLRNNDTTKEMGEAGRKYVREKHTWDHVANRILTVMEKQLTGS